MPEGIRKLRIGYVRFFRQSRWAALLGLRRNPSHSLGALATLALQGEDTGKILTASANALLDLSGADRAGVWVEASSHETLWTGKVAPSAAGSVPARWTTLDPSQIFRGPASQTANFIEFRSPELPFEPAGFFDGMEAALCFPLAQEGRRFGVALLAGRFSRFLARREILRDAACEIAAALSLGSARQQCLIATRSFQSRVELDRAIAANAPVDEILRLMAAAVVRNTGAEFAGFARMQASALHWTVLSGSESQAANSHPALREVALGVLNDGQPAIRGFPPGNEPSVWLAGLALHPRESGSPLLLAGYRSEDEVPLDRLREFVATAVSACKTAQSQKAASRTGQDEGEHLAAELRSLLESVQCGVLLLDVHGRLRHANACLRDFLSLGGQGAGSIHTFDELARLAEPLLRNPGEFSVPWHAFAHGAGADFRDELVFAGRARRVLAREARPVLGADERPIGWLELYRDITSQRQIHSKLVQTEKMAALGQLVSGIAHELNNPLTSIMGYAQLLLGRAAAETPGGEAKLIFEEAERARRIVKNLLFFARKAEPERTRVDINEIVERTVALRGYELKIENIAVAMDMALGLPPTLADPVQLQQVVLNLLVNAEQAILESRGQGRIEIRTRKISPARLAMEVTDDGPGIPPEIVSRIFDPFFTTKAPGVGTGLGLSIVYGIVEQHGGEVAFENLRGGGAKFTVALPLVAVPAPAPGPVADTVPCLSGRSAGRVLVIEDEPTVAQLVADVLREDGHQVETVLDSQEGLKRVSRSSYDLIICDLRMPRLDGPAFYDALVRADSPARHHILFITGDTLGPRTVDFLKSRRLPFLGKPFLVEELKLAVNRILQGSENTEPAQAAGTRGA